MGNSISANNSPQAKSKGKADQDRKKGKPKPNDHNFVIPKNWKKSCAKNGKWCQEFIVHGLVARKAKKLMKGIKRKKLTKKERKKVEYDCGALAVRYLRYLNFNYCCTGAGAQLVNRFITDVHKNMDMSDEASTGRAKRTRKVNKVKNKRSGLATDQSASSSGSLWLIAILIIAIAIAAVAVYLTFFKQKDKPTVAGEDKGAGGKSRKSVRSGAKGNTQTGGAAGKSKGGKSNVGKSNAGKSSKSSKLSKGTASSKGPKSKVSKKSKKLKSIKSKKSGKK